MKRILVFSIGLIGAIYFVRLATIFIATDVSGTRYFSLFISGKETNGFSYYQYWKPYLRITINSDVKPRICIKLDKKILSYTGGTESVLREGPYSVISESGEKAYSAYIKTGSSLLYVRGFPDFAGQGPDEGEKNICVNE